MTSNVISRRGLASIAAACLVSVALPAIPAMAQKVKTRTPTQEAVAAAPAFSISIPTVDAVDSSVDEETIRAIISGDLVDNAEALATLDASSITVPEIRVTITTTIDGAPEESTLVFNNLVLENVSKGVASSVSLDGSSFTAPDGSAEMGAMSAANFNMAGVLDIYGLVDDPGWTSMETLYSDFVLEGGSFEAEDASCQLGSISTAEVRARPLDTSLIEFAAVMQQLEDNPDDPSPETLGKVFRIYADFLTAFETEEFVVDGLSCDGVDDEGRSLTIAVAGMTMGGMSPGIYPSIAMDGFALDMGDEGTIALGNVTIKRSDFTSAIATLESAPERIDDGWLAENVRSMIPAFEGFALSDLSVDIPDPDVDGERIVADVDAFDLTLGGYINGIPSVLDTSATGIRVQLPEDGGDEQLQQLVSLGITDIDAGFRVAASWNAGTSSIDVEEISLSGVDLATVVLSGTLANATEALFSSDENEAMMAGLALAVKTLNLDITDAGLSDIILAIAAAEQGADPATLRPVFAGLAEGTIIGVMAGAADAANLGSAINRFVSGAAKSLSIGIEAKNDPGLSMIDFAAAEEDPTVLIDKVNITATAE
ncbi:hypothetical protein SAMN05216456_1228 [Devosia crocina]|uniref:Choice-of-anchor G family protein n=1 Tax=Devosia crocina TaxID=429728 RepID=A0A1I7N8W8_9HYPH|nr:hypothetical protein [Devosia crocina]SFV31088.1 hypothetical protein SAMN05216456_1228 [Devosia crocina]